MGELISFASGFLSFLKDTLVPWLVSVPDSFTFYNPLIFFLGKLPVLGDLFLSIFGDGQIVTIPWPFGDQPIAFVFFGSTLVFLLAFKFIKFFTDVIL